MRFVPVMLIASQLFEKIEPEDAAEEDIDLTGEWHTGRSIQPNDIFVSCRCATAALASAWAR